MGVLVVGVCCRIVTFHVGVVVCISLPLVSLWANFLGSALPLLAVRLRKNPAVTSAPLMTTIIDSTGLLIYFYVAMFYMPYAQGHQADQGHHNPHHNNHHNNHFASHEANLLLGDYYQPIELARDGQQANVTF